MIFLVSYNPFFFPSPHIIILSLYCRHDRLFCPCGYQNQGFLPKSTNSLHSWLESYSPGHPRHTKSSRPTLLALDVVSPTPATLENGSSWMTTNTFFPVQIAWLRFQLPQRRGVRENWWENFQPTHCCPCGCICPPWEHQTWKIEKLHTLQQCQPSMHPWYYPSRTWSTDIPPFQGQQLYLPSYYVKDPPST